MQLRKGFVYASRFGWEWLWQKLFLKPFTRKRRCLKENTLVEEEVGQLFQKTNKKAIWGTYSKMRLQQ